MPVPVDHTYNPRLLGRLKSGRSQFKASPGSEFTRPISTNN
jgi:hypothetical protein